MCHINGVLGENEYLTGTCPTLADIFIFNNFCQVAFDPTFECPGNIDSVKAWTERMEALPCAEAACKKFTEITKMIHTMIKEQTAAAATEQAAAEPPATEE